MSKDLQKDFVQILKQKTKPELVSVGSVNRWGKGLSSPTLINVCEICEKNDIYVLFFDGNIESLLKFNKEMGEKLGFKVQLIFE